MSPAKIEGALKEGCSLIGQAMAVGDGRPYNVALLTLDPDAASSWAQAHGMEGAAIADLAADERARAEVAAGVERGNERLARVEQIKYFALLGDEWLPGGDELTPTSKLKRKAINAKYAAQIDELYRR
jgi:long-subunit acyl-CoA synthetase (AMP-forming)